MLAIGSKRKCIYLIFCFLLLLSLLTVTGTALGSIIDEDEDENESSAIDVQTPLLIHKVIKNV